MFNLQLQRNKNVFIFMFIFNAVLFGVANLVDLVAGHQDNIKNYPTIPFAAWSAILAFLAYRGWKPFFYSNSIALAIIMIVSVFSHKGTGLGDQSVTSIVQVVLLPTGIVVGLIWQGVAGFGWWKERRKRIRDEKLKAPLNDKDEFKDHDLEEVVTGPGGRIDTSSFKGLAKAILNPDVTVHENALLIDWQYQSFHDFTDIVEIVGEAQHLYKTRRFNQLDAMLIKLPLVLKKKGSPIEYCRVIFVNAMDPVLGKVDYMTKTLDCKPDQETLEQMMHGLGAADYHIESVEVEPPRERVRMYSVISQSVVNAL